MKIFTQSNLHIKLRLGNMRYRARNWLFNVIGKNPYPEGSVGSFSWKIERGRPLNEEERRARDEMEELSKPLARHLETSQRATFHMTYVWFAMQLMHNLPKSLRDDLGTTPLRDARQKIDLLLPLASYQRERTSIRLAGYALTVSMLAFIISVATLGIAVWTLIISGDGS